MPIQSNHTENFNSPTNVILYYRHHSKIISRMDIRKPENSGYTYVQAHHQNLVITTVLDKITKSGFLKDSFASLNSALRSVDSEKDELRTSYKDLDKLKKSNN